MLHLWRFRAWSDSRWCGIAGGARCIIACVFVGLADLAAFIIGSPAYSSYHIGGFQHLTTDIVGACVVVTASSGVTEHCLLKVLDDDRLAKNISEIDQVIEQEAQVAISMPDAILDFVASTCGLPVPQLRGRVARALAVQAGYMQHKFRDARRLPFSLVGGNVREKLLQMAAGGRPEDETAATIYELLKLGYPLVELEQAVDLLGQTSWSTTCVEQGHSAAAQVVRRHPEYSSSLMAARSMIIQARTLFATSKVERGIHRAQRSILRLQSKRPDRIRGRHMFFRTLCQQATRSKAWGKVLKTRFSKDIIKGHSRVWSSLNEADRQIYEESAVDLRDDRAARHREQLLQAQARLRRLRSELFAERDSSSAPMRMSRCRLSPTEQADFASFLHSEFMNQKDIQKSQSAACQPVQQPGETVKLALGLMGESPQAPKPEQPEWLPWMACHRDFFQICIIKTTLQGDTRFFVFVFAIQNPVLVCVSEVFMVHEEEPLLSAACFEQQRTEIWDRVFRWEVGHALFSDEGVFNPQAEFSTLTDAIYRHPRRLCADGDFVPLAVVQGFVAGASGAAATAARDRP